MTRAVRAVAWALLVLALLAMAGLCGRMDYEDRVRSLSGGEAIACGGSHRP
jgi:hypothetical protein